jgi:hypothetical protein
VEHDRTPWRFGKAVLLQPPRDGEAYPGGSPPPLSRLSKTDPAALIPVSPAETGVFVSSPSADRAGAAVSAEVSLVSRTRAGGGAERSLSSPVGQEV